MFQLLPHQQIKLNSKQLIKIDFRRQAGEIKDYFLCFDFDGNNQGHVSYTLHKKKKKQW